MAKRALFVKYYKGQHPTTGRWFLQDYSLHIQVGFGWRCYLKGTILICNILRIFWEYMHLIWKDGFLNQTTTFHLPLTLYQEHILMFVIFRLVNKENWEEKGTTNTVFNWVSLLCRNILTWEFHLQNKNTIQNTEYNTDADFCD